MNKTLTQQAAPLLMIALGVAAFYFAFGFVLEGKEPGKQFQELDWDARTTLTQLIDAGLDDTTATTARAAQMKALLIVPGASRMGDTLRYNQRTALLKSRDQVASADLSLLTAIAKRRLMFDSVDIRRLKMDTLAGGKIQTVLPLVYVDTTLPARVIKAEVALSVRPYDWRSFFLKYPSFGNWALLLIIQLVFYVLVLPALFLRLFKSYDNFSTALKIVYIFILIGVCLLVYVRALNPRLTDGNIIRPELFMPRVMTVFKVVNATGYITAALCLAGMLICYGTVIGIKSNVALANQQKELEKMNANFKFFLIIAAVIMTFGVVATGQFYTSLNSLDFVSAYNNFIGYSYFRMEMVYLYGALHTLLLLAYYVPVQLKLNAVNAEMIASAPGAAAVKTLDPVPVFKRVSELLAIGAPVMAALLKSFLDFLATIGS